MGIKVFLEDSKCRSSLAIVHESMMPPFQGFEHCEI